jgi:hypothetical protein
MKHFHIQWTPKHLTTPQMQARPSSAPLQMASTIMHCSYPTFALSSGVVLDCLNCPLPCTTIIDCKQGSHILGKRPRCHHLKYPSATPSRSLLSLSFPLCLFFNCLLRIRIASLSLTRCRPCSSSSRQRSHSLAASSAHQQLI